MRRALPYAALAACLLGLSPSSRPAPGAVDSFLPENDLNIPVGSAEAKGITPEQFNEVLDRIQEIYGPIIASKGGTLKIERLWDNGTVNAQAQRIGSTYIIRMFGGLARHETITQDGFALVACHEIGHHLGGFPNRGWASNEGQSDYFANAKCLRIVFAKAQTASFTRMEGSDDFAESSCAGAFAGEADRRVCVRGAMAGKSVSYLFKALRREEKDPRFDTPDPSRVAQTNNAHPGTQCRMDTYFQGSLCAKPASDDFGPDPAQGACVASQGFRVGMRPRCWYKPPASEPDSAAPQVVAVPWSEPAASSTGAPRRGRAWSSLADPGLWSGI